MALFKASEEFPLSSHSDNAMLDDTVFFAIVDVFKVESLLVRFGQKYTCFSYRMELALLLPWLQQRAKIRIFDSICCNSDSKQGHFNAFDLFQSSGGAPLSYMLRVIFPI